MMVLNIIFSFNLAMLLIHEMDGVRCREWSLFIILRDLTDSLAYVIYVIAHIPLYSIIFYFLCFSYDNENIMLMIDLFILVHALLHFCFRNHMKNEFNSFLSKLIIYGAAFTAAVHLCFDSFFQSSII